MSLLQIGITGICAFADNGVTKVVLPNARDLANITSNEEVHSAVFVAPRANIYSGCREADFFFSRGDSVFGKVDEILAGWFLYQEELSFGSGSIVPDPTGSTVDDCPIFKTGRNAEDFYWITQMPSGSDVMKVSDFSGSLVSSMSVIARLVFPSVGALRTKSFSLNNDGDRILKWSYRVDPSSTEYGIPRSGKYRAIAEAIEYIVDQSKIGTTVTFKSTRASRDIILDLSTGDVQLWLVNMPLPDLLTDRRDKGKPRKPDYHFHHFYHISTNGSPSILIPHPHLEGTDDCGFPGGGGVANPKCPPTFFTAVA